MEINLDLNQRRQWLLGLLGCVCVGLAVLGRFVTPTLADRPQVLTPARWQALALLRQATGEIQQLTTDAQTLRAVAAQAAPDAIQALSLAQRVYATHRHGTAATAPARQALIQAAEATARYAAGGVERTTAVSAVNAALARIQALMSVAVAEPAHAKSASASPTPMARRRYLPLVYGGGTDRVRAER